ncbi:MAG: hypothetical protein RLZZ628_3817 [Bacteroidota bacterium]|jgi:hypothetical protein
MIRTDVRISRISLIRTDFFWNECLMLGKKRKKSVRIGEIREICTSVRTILFQILKNTINKKVIDKSLPITPQIILNNYIFLKTRT